MLRSREGHPSLQRPHRPARAHRRAGRPRQQPALVVAPADARPVRRDRPQALGQGPQGPGRACCPPCPPHELADLAADEEFVARVARRGRGPADLPHRAALVPAWAAEVEGGAPALDRLLQPRVRHHRGAAAVLRRPRHPRRRPPQGRLRPRRARSSASACSTRPATSSSRLNRDGWQQETYPVLDPDGLPLTLLREADGTPCVDHPRPARRPHAARPTSGGPRSAACRCCCSTPTSRSNDDAVRNITDRLYGGGGEHRLQQEMLLGIGGVRALRLWSRLTGAPAPEVFHTNEGHAGFLGLERIRELTSLHRPDLRRGARGGARRHGVHHPHAGARPASTGSAPT